MCALEIQARANGPASTARPVGGRSNLLQRRGAKVVAAPNSADRK
jgi:hypothetical protein